MRNRVGRRMGEARKEGGRTGERGVLTGGTNVHWAPRQVPSPLLSLDLHKQNNRHRFKTHGGSRSLP